MKTTRRKLWTVCICVFVCMFWFSLFRFVQRFASLFVFWWFDVFLDFLQLILLGSLKPQNSISTKLNCNSKTMTLLDNKQNKTATNTDVCAVRVRIQIRLHCDGQNLLVVCQSRCILHKYARCCSLRLATLLFWVRLEAEQSVIKVVRKPESNKSHSVSWVSFSPS